jgi:hypothetical protein
MRHLGLTLMNGLMFYLRDQPSLPDAGACADSPWSLGFVPQARLWEGDFAERYGDGSVREKISVSIANFDAPGVLFGKSARKCTPAQLARDCWAQIKEHVNNVGAAPTLTDEMLHSWNLDPGLKRRHGQFVSEDPLILPRAGTERYRPDVSTGLRNLTLCGDYLNGEWEVTNMEAASFNGRRAANAVLDESRSREEPSRTILPYRPPEWEPLRKVDEDRYRRGQPNMFDADLSLDEVKQLLGEVVRS